MASAEVSGNPAGIKSYIVTSCKGGIGKSTVSANLAASMADQGHRVLISDCDFSNRSLDIFFNCTESVVYDIIDLVNEKCTPEQAVISVPGHSNLFFIPAPAVYRGTFTAEQLKSALLSAAASFDCDVIIIDTPGAADWILPAVAPAAQTALVVASHNPASVRGAEKTGYFLESLGLTDQYLIVNRFDIDKTQKNQRLGINELIDQTHIPLIGVIPDSGNLELEQEKGNLALRIDSDGDCIGKAFSETASRICGERIPIMAYLPEKKRRLLLGT